MSTALGEPKTIFGAELGKANSYCLCSRSSGGRVYARPMPNVMRVVVPPGSTIYSDGFRSDAGLLTNSDRHWLMLKAQMFAHSHRRPINGIENFWSSAETKLQFHVGIRRSHFVRYWKEMELRINHPHEELLLLLVDS